MVLLPYICQNSSNSFWNGSRLKKNQQQKPNFYVQLSAKEVWQSYIHSTFSGPLWISFTSKTTNRMSNEWPSTWVNRNVTWVTDTFVDENSPFFYLYSFLPALLLVGPGEEIPLSTAGIPCEQGKIFMLLPEAVVTADPSSGWSKSPEAHHSIQAWNEEKKALQSFTGGHGQKCKFGKN